MAEFEIIFMDSGQGDCTLIVYPDGSLTLVDCGSTKGGGGPDGAFAAIKLVLERYLKSTKNKIQNLVLTHADEDHYNQLRRLTSFVTFEYVYFGSNIDLYKNNSSGEKNATYNFLTKMVGQNKAGAPPNSYSTTPDKRLSRQGVNVTVLAANSTGFPKRKSSTGKNCNSIVLLVEYRGTKFFLMGDAFKRVEKGITDTFTKAKILNRLKKGANEHIVLKMGHHGSDTSTSPEWVRLTTPEVLVFSSATKRFTGKGMPTKKHLADTIKLTTLSADGIDQTYVVFDEDNAKVRDKQFVTLGPTGSSVWATCYSAEYQPKPDRYLESGQTWYYGIGGTVKKPLNWFGYTGYEENDDDSED